VTGTKDIMDKWLIPPIVAENEQLKARVIALEAELATMEEASVRNGIALQREAREAERTRIAKLEAERDAAIKLANLHQAMWRDAEQDVVNLTEPLKYGDMLCFTRGTFDEKVKEMEDMRARIAELEAKLRTKSYELATAVNGATAAVLAEREACAQIADRWTDDYDRCGRTIDGIAAAIRARPAP
jgi:cell division septum initiation protein DivIVA